MSCTRRRQIKTKKTQLTNFPRKKADLVTQFIKVQNNTESTDSRIQNITDCMEIKVHTGVNSLKWCILKELTDIKNSIKNEKKNESVQQRLPAVDVQNKSTNGNRSNNKKTLNNPVPVNNQKSSISVHCWRFYYKTPESG